MQKNGGIKAQARVKENHRNALKIPCPHCSGTGRVLYLGMPPTRCFVCRGEKIVSPERLENPEVKYEFKMQKILDYGLFAIAAMTIILAGAFIILLFSQILKLLLTH